MKYTYHPLMTVENFVIILKDVKKKFILNFQSLVLIPPQSVYKKDFAMN